MFAVSEADAATIRAAFDEIAMTDAAPPSQWSAAAFLATLARRGIVVLTVDGAIVVYPEPQLTDAERAAIREHRAALMPMLAAAVVIE